MRIAELFYSIQGEGKLMGLPSAFVRVSGCNLRCVWCDTPYASWDPQGQDMTVEQIVQQLDQFKTAHVVLTGGEPLIMPDVVELCQALKDRDYHVTVETAATVFRPLKLDLASLSPKLANSTPADPQLARTHQRLRLNIPVIQQFIDSSPDFQLKFVVAERGDMQEIHRLLEQLRGWKPHDVLLMPQGTDVSTLNARAGWIAEVCKATGFRYCPRLHIELWGNVRGR